jgi:serine/threonine-protein kinase RsbW
MTEPDLRLQLTSDPRYLCAVRECLAAATRQLGFTEDQCCHIVLAVDEAVSNVMQHGYEGCCDRPIWVSLFRHTDSVRGAGVRIVIEDEGRQVDPAEIRGRDLSDLRPGGLGVHVITRVMDSALYEKRGTCGMRLTMIKYLGSGGGTPSPPATGATHV